MGDPYKVKIIESHLEQMGKDTYYHPQLAGMAGKNINLDRGALELLKDYYERNGGE